MTGHFTFPIRPELPPGHPGFGIPLPKDKRRRQERLDGMFRGIDRNRDGFWSREEFIANMRGGRGKPLLIAIRPGGQGDITDTHLKWELNRSIPEIPSTLLYDNLFTWFETAASSQQSMPPTESCSTANASTHPANTAPPPSPQMAMCISALTGASSPS